MMNLIATPESRALRHAFFGKLAASTIPDVQDDTPVRKVAKVGIIGAGTMDGGIAGISWAPASRSPCWPTPRRAPPRVTTGEPCGWDPWIMNMKGNSQ
jgi:hypothetical protein